MSRCESSLISSAKYEKREFDFFQFVWLIIFPYLSLKKPFLEKGSSKLLQEKREGVFAFRNSSIPIILQGPSISPMRLSPHMPIPFFV